MISAPVPKYFGIGAASTPHIYILILTFVIFENEDIFFKFRPRSTMDSIRVSEAPDSGSIPDEATNKFMV
jgi:hypothetical protein